MSVFTEKLVGVLRTVLLALFVLWPVAVGAVEAPAPDRAPAKPKAAPKAADAANSDAVTDKAEPEATPDPLVTKAKAESQKLRDVWDHSRLESTVYEKRYNRAYDRWVKAAKEGKAEALKRRDKAFTEFKISLEKRRLSWYEWELAKAKQVSLEAEAKARGLRDDVKRVQARIEALGGTWKPTPVPTKAP